MSVRPASPPPDRRASRLLGLAHPGDAFGPREITGCEALELVISVYGAERLSGRGTARISDRALRDAVRRLAVEARSSDAIRAERMLIDLRARWNQLTSVRRATNEAARSALWGRIVLLCCEEFYASAPPAEVRPISTVA